MSSPQKGDDKGDLAGLGPRDGVPRLSATVEWSSLHLDDVKGFVLSRVDGRTSLRDILLLAPFPEAETVSILGELFARGVIDVPGVPRPVRHTLPGAVEAPPPEPPPPPKEEPVVVRPAPRMVVKPAAQEGDTVELVPEVRQRVDDVFALLGDSTSPTDARRLLGLAADADKKAVKRAYFNLSKEFHPDRYFRKNLGDYQQKMLRIFHAVKEAYETLEGANP